MKTLIRIAFALIPLFLDSATHGATIIIHATGVVSDIQVTPGSFTNRGPGSGFAFMIGEFGDIGQVYSGPIAYDNSTGQPGPNGSTIFSVLYDNFFPLSNAGSPGDPLPPGVEFITIFQNPFGFQFTGDPSFYEGVPFDLNMLSMNQNGFVFEPVTGSFDDPGDNGSAIYSGPIKFSVPETGTTANLLWIALVSLLLLLRRQNRVDRRCGQGRRPN
jgi:hypothetical protein